MNTILRGLSLAVLCLPLASNATEDSDNIRSKAERFVGQSIKSIFCEPIEERRGSPIDPETCEYLSGRSLETCWSELFGLLPILSKPVDEYSAFFENPKDLDQLRQAVYGCIKGGTFLRGEDASLYWELQFGPVEEPEEPVLAGSWESAVEFIVAQSASKTEAVLSFVEAFRSSEYMAVNAPLDGFVFVTVSEQDDLVTSKLEDPPDWVIAMRDLGFISVNRISSTIRVIGDFSVVTSKHEFPFELVFEDVEDVPICDTAFEKIDCGVCVGAASADFHTLVTWVPKDLHSESLDPDSVEDGDLQRERVMQCISTGIDEALGLQESRQKVEEEEPTD